MSVPNTFVAGTTASASEVNANFTNLENYLGYAQITSSFSSTTVNDDVDVTNLSVTVTVPSGGRKIKITAFAQSMYVGTNVADLELRIKESSTVLQASSVGIAVNKRVSYNVVYVGTATAGSHTYKIAIRQNAVNTMTLDAAATFPAFILVEQI